jgi:hypothetical protein
MTTITQLPDPPSTADPANFSAEADAFIAALPTLVDEINEFGAALNSLSTTSSSVSSVLMGTGTKNFTVETGKSYFVGMSLKLAFDATNWMVGEVISYDSGTGALSVNVVKVTGSGTRTAWVITLGFNGVVGTGQLDDLAVTTSKLADDVLTAAKIADSALGFSMINGKIVGSVAANALTVAVKTFAGNDPSAADPVLVLFRNATLTDGSYSVVSITAATSLTVSSGSTLGTIATIQANLAVLILNNAGTAELAINNLSGGVNLDGTGVISTTAEGGAGAADSATVIYSTTARSNVAYRPVALMEITEATPGTWATAHTKLIPISAPQSLMSLGLGQTWQNLTASRAINVTYYNTTGKPIFVSTSALVGAAGNYVALSINGISITSGQAYTAGTRVHISAVVPPGVSYALVNIAGSNSVDVWSELR